MRSNEMYVQPGYLLRRMHQLATAAFSAVNVDSNITAVQFAALLTIRDHPGIDATRLAEAIRFDRTTIGHVIGRLEQKGFVIRTEGSMDKRTKQLRITEDGIAMLKLVSPRVKEVSNLLLAPLSAAEREEFLRILRVLDKHATGPAGLVEDQDDA